MHYLHNHLNRVAFQANFNTIEALKVNLHQSVIDICTRLSGTPLKRGELTNIVITNIPNQSGFTQKFPSFNFEGERYVIQIQNSVMNISDKSYTHHNDFHGIVSEIYNQFNNIYHPSFSRFSLRYSNNLSYPEGNTFDFGNIIDNSLLGATMHFRDFGLTRTLGMINIHGDDDINVNFTYGFLNTSEFPNRIAKREFVLDYDCFTAPAINPADIRPTLLLLRARVNDLFEQSIMPGLRGEMQPQN